MNFKFVKFALNHTAQCINHCSVDSWYQRFCRDTTWQWPAMASLAPSGMEGCLSRRWDMWYNIQGKFETEQSYALSLGVPQYFGQVVLVFLTSVPILTRILNLLRTNVMIQQCLSPSRGNVLIFKLPPIIDTSYMQISHISNVSGVTKDWTFNL